MHTIWITVLYQPLVNILVFLINTVAFGNLGVAVIILTVFVKFLLFPLTRRSIVSQLKMKAVAPEIKKLKETGLSKAEQAQKQMEIYKRNGINPLSGCLPMLIQIPVIFALFFVLRDGITGIMPLLYPFIHMPEQVSLGFLGVTDMTKPSIVFAVLAAVAQYLQLHFSTPASKTATVTTPGKRSFQDDLSDNMTKQMKYIIPPVIFIAGLQFSAAVALYYVTTSIFTMLQELAVRRKQSVTDIILP